MSLIVIEGIDASGKETQTKLLTEWLGRSGRPACRGEFPNYNTKLGSSILEVLKSEDLIGGGKAMRALVLQCMMTVNRLEVVPEIRVKSAPPNIYVLDRYYASGLVYGMADGLELEFLDTIHCTLPHPDLCVFLDVPVEESWVRRPDRRDVYERDRELLEKVRTGYQQLFARKASVGAPWVIVDGRGTVEEVHNRIRTCVSSHTGIS